jgi:hypothetical protein
MPIIAGTLQRTRYQRLTARRCEAGPAVPRRSGLGMRLPVLLALRPRATAAWFDGASPMVIWPLWLAFCPRKTAVGRHIRAPMVVTQVLLAGPAHSGSAGCLELMARCVRGVCAAQRLCCTAAQMLLTRPVAAVIGTANCPALTPGALPGQARPATNAIADTDARMRPAAAGTTESRRSTLMHRRGTATWAAGRTPSRTPSSPTAAGAETDRLGADGSVWLEARHDFRRYG